MRYAHHVPAAPSSPQLAGELRAAVIMAARRIRAQRGAADLADPQYSVLVHLDKRGPLTPGQLADAERVQPPTMTRTVNCLVERGLVAKAPHETDGRVVVVTITDAGRQEIAETRRRRTDWLAARLRAMTPEERAVLADAAQLLRGIAEA